MITDISNTVDPALFNSLLKEIPYIDFKLTINQPSGNFFYDPWIIRDDFKNTVWEEILKTLPFDKGEARLIKLSKKECYMAHADIDNRWHLPIINGKSFLVDLENLVLHKLESGKWYYMDASRDHSAVNFGEEDRLQLVVRELLVKGNLSNPKKVSIRPKQKLSDIRYIFDSVYSPWLNQINKQGMMNNFVADEYLITFDIESGIEIPPHPAFDIL